MRNLSILLVVLYFVIVGPVSAREWKMESGINVMVYYDKAPRDFVNTVESAAEEYYRGIFKNLGFGPYERLSGDDRIKIYIYDDPEDYIQSGKQAVWSHGAASASQKTIKTFPTAHGFFDSTLPHEVGHIVFRQFVGTRADVPLWFEEGVAMYQEQAKRFGAHNAVKEAIKRDFFIPLPELNKIRSLPNADNETVQLFYAESASVVNYLIVDQGRHRFTRLCRLLKDGRKFEEALSESYVRFSDLEKLNSTWIKFLKP